MFFNFKIACCCSLFLLLLLQEPTSSGNVRETIKTVAWEMKNNPPVQACERFATLDKRLKSNPSIHEPATVALNKIISKLNQQKQFGVAIKVYQQGIKDGIPRDTITHTAVIQAYCKKGNTNEARKIFETMDGKDTRTLNTMISGYIDNQQFDKAIKLYDNANIYGIPKDTITYNAVVKAYCGFQDTETARHIFESMKYKDTYTLNTMIAGYTDTEQFDKAIELYRNCHKYRIPKDTITKNAVIKAYCGIGAINTARDVFDSMKDKSIITLSTMISGYIDNQQFKKAIQLYEHRFGIPKNTITHTAAIKAYCGISDTIKARRIFDSMRDKNTHTLNTMIKCYINNDQLIEAIQLYEQNNGITKNIVTHNAGMEAYCKHKSFNQSQAIFEKFMNVASSTTKCEINHLFFFNTALMCWELQYANTNATIIQTRFNKFVPAIYKPPLTHLRKIDLHGFPYFFAKYSVIQHLSHLKINESLTIVTGKGRHRDSKLPQMMEQLSIEFNKTHTFKFGEIEGVKCFVCLCFIICKNIIIYK